MASGDAVNQHNVEKSNDYEAEATSTDRSLLDFMKKDDQDDSKVVTTEFDDKIHVSEPESKPELEPKFEECKVEEDEDKVAEPAGLLHKLHRSTSNPGSNEEEVEEGGEKKKGLKEKIAEKIHKEEDTEVPVSVMAEPEENKGPLDKIKDKLPIGGNKVEEETVAAPPPVKYDTVEGGEPAKKGLIEKIKDKLQGGGHKAEEENVSPAEAPQVDHYATLEGGEHAKKGTVEKIKEKMPGNHSKTTATEEEKKHNDYA